MMPLLNLLATIVVFGVGLWLVNAFIPMAMSIKQLLNIVVLVIVVIYVLQFFNLIKPLLPMLKLF